LSVEDAWKLYGQIIQTINMEERGRTEKIKNEDSLNPRLLNVGLLQH